MKETEITIEPLSLTFQVKGDEWTLSIPKSRTNIQYTDQLNLITRQSNQFVPLTIEEQDDTYLFTYVVNKRFTRFTQLKNRHKHEKLRALCNIYYLRELLASRVTYFLHPNNIVFNENLMPVIIQRGIRNLVQPFEMTEPDFLKQYKCLAIALFSNQYSFDDLWNGSLEKAKKTSFEKQVNEKESLEELVEFLKESYAKEQRLIEQTTMLVPKKRFKLFQHVSIWVSIVAVVFLSFLIYTSFVKIPYQERLLTAHNHFLADDYSEVILTLQNEDVEKLPHSSKYILAYSFIKVEQLSEREKEAIMRNINLKSDRYYLLYWIYNGLGDFDQSIDTAKYMDDPQLIIYGLIKKTEQVKNDPNLTGAEREEEVSALREELEKYTDEYELLDEIEEMEEPQDALPIEEERDEIESDEEDKLNEKVDEEEKEDE